MADVWANSTACHSIATCHTAGCCHLVNLLSWFQSHMVHAARFLANIELSFHPCNILRDNRRARGISKGNKNVGCGTWKRRFFAIAVRITGKLLNIDRDMLRWAWQALNCLFIYATFCVIATVRGVPMANKKWRPGYIKMTIFFAIVVRITGKLL